MEATLHVHWDVYGTFCIVPSDSDASTMLEALCKINEDWAKHDASEGHVRPLDVCFYFVVPEASDGSSRYPNRLLPDHIGRLSSFTLMHCSQIASRLSLRKIGPSIGRERLHNQCRRSLGRTGLLLKTNSAQRRRPMRLSIHSLFRMFVPPVTSLFSPLSL